MERPHWTARRFFHTGDAFFDSMTAAIRGARRSVRIEVYIFHIDAFTENFLEELHQARRRGCEVQLLVDGIGSYFWLETLGKRCRDFGIELRVWRPLPRGLATWRLLLLPLKFRVIRFFRRVNRRDHRKITLIDDQIAYVGSMNLTQVHSERAVGPQAWRDSGVRLEGGSVPDLLEAFLHTWRRAGRASLKTILNARRFRLSYDPRRSLVRLNTTRAHRRFLNRDLVRRINRARVHVSITSAYFLPTRAVMWALNRAARRGVPVQIVVPGTSDVPMVKWAATGGSKILLKNGVRLFEFQRSILHAKYFLIDDWASLGSTNLNFRSLFHDLESEAVFSDPESLAELRAQWARDAAESRELSLTLLRQRPWWRSILESLAFRVRYLL